MALNPSHRELGTQRWKDQRLRVLKRDSYICQYCGEDATQVDHVIPRSRGGGHELDNLLACCAKCNTLKGISSLDLDVERNAENILPLTSTYASEWPPLLQE